MSVVVGIFNLFLAIGWVVYYREPYPGERGEATCIAAEKAGEGSGLWKDLGYLLGCRETWVAMLGYTGVVYLSSLFVTWLPAWLQRTEGLSVVQAGLLSALPQVFSFIGCLGGGKLVDMISHSGVSPLTSCQRIVAISMLLCAVSTAVLAIQPGQGLALAILALALLANGVAVSCGWTLGTLIATENRVATLEAIQNTGASFGGVLAPLLTGILAARFGSFGPAFLLAGLVGLLSMAMYYYGFSRKA